MPGAFAAESDAWTVVSNIGETFTVGALAETAPDEAGWEPFEGGAPQGWEGESVVADLPVLPPALPPGIALESVIGTDGRRQVTGTSSYPYRAIAYLSVNFGGSSYMCTGWFVGPDTLATAGHCVHEGGGGNWATSITVYPGRNGGTLPYGSVAATKWASVNGWTQDGRHDFDYGAIRVASPVGDTVGWFGFRRARSGDKGRRIWVTGYPADKPGGTMWQMKARLRRLTKRKVFYPIDTYGGQSGSPVRFSKGPSVPLDERHWGLGVHAYAVGIQPYPQYNSGTKMNGPVFTNYVYWRNDW